jgi:hypothetical protein
MFPEWLQMFPERLQMFPERLQMFPEWLQMSELAKTATTDKGSLPHLSDLVDLSEKTLKGASHRAGQLGVNGPPQPFCAA